MFERKNTYASYQRNAANSLSSSSPYTMGKGIATALLSGCEWYRIDLWCGVRRTIRGFSRPLLIWWRPLALLVSLYSLWIFKGDRVTFGHVLLTLKKQLPTNNFPSSISWRMDVRGQPKNERFLIVVSSTKRTPSLFVVNCISRSSPANSENHKKFLIEEQ